MLSGVCVTTHLLEQLLDPARLPCVHLVGDESVCLTMLNKVTDPHGTYAQASQMAIALGCSIS
jgi:hypothetical protein